jgi:sulfite reductase (NADPH) hemoprotein beta-component
MRRRIDKEFAELKAGGVLELPASELQRIAAFFAPPTFESLPAESAEFEAAKAASADFAAWTVTNIHPHKIPGYALATISLKPIGLTPGDCSAEQMEKLADIMDDFGFAEIRVTHEQNLLLPHVRRKDYCDLANARSIPIAQAIAKRFSNPGLQAELGEVKIKISGCINACGHHHLGHIGILGVDRKGVENYQILLGGSGAEDASLGEILGPAFDSEGIIDAVENVISTYRELRRPDERFLDTYRRLGAVPFRERLYAH